MATHKNPIDSFFRESLEDHTVRPSDESKAAFLKEIAASGTGNAQRRWLLFLPLVILVAIGGGYGLYSSIHKQPAKIQPPAETSQNLISSSSTTSAPTLNISEQKPSETSTQNTEKYSKPSFIQYNTLTSSDAASLAELSSGDNTRESSQPASVPASPISENKIEPEPDKPVSTEPVLEENKPEPLVNPSKIEDKNQMPPVPRPDNPKQKQPREWNFLVGAYYQPEWLFNTLDNDKYVNNAGVTGTFYMNGFSVTTGAGVSITTGYNELSVAYNDYLGSYNSLDSITFAWNIEHTKLMPTYFMTNQKVWDSLVKLDYPKIEKRYTYLQIPLTLGYDFIRTNHFSLGLRAGPILSILLSTKVLSQPYNAGENQIIEINNITPDRISLNWQVMGGVAASVNITKNIMFQVLPQAKYYFNSVYEKSDVSKKPWSVGVQGSFLIKL
jgi:hypothetical protein